MHLSQNRGDMIDVIFIHLNNVQQHCLNDSGKILGEFLVIVIF